MNRNALMNAIRKIRPGVSENSIVETSKFVMFEETHLVSFNDEVAVSVPFEIGIRASVHADSFLKLVGKMASGRISVELGDNEVVISDGKTTAGFAVSGEAEQPDIGLSSIKKWHDLPEDFCKAVSFCAFSAATDISKGVLTCVNISGGTVSSCDNFRLTTYDMEYELPEAASMMIPRKVVNPLVESSPIKVAITGDRNNWLHFQNEDGVIFSCRQMPSGTYPDIEHLLDVEGERVVLPRDMSETLERTEILAAYGEYGGQFVEFHLSKDKMLCRGESDRGWIEESVDIEYDGPELSLIADPHMISQILKHVNVATVGDRMLFEGDNFKHVISLMDEE